MSIADELDAGYEQYEIKSNVQGYALRRFAGDLAEGFAKYVGAAPNVWNKPDGRVGGKRVQLGRGDFNDFTPMQWPDLPASLGEVEFSVSYTLASRATGSSYQLVYVIRAKSTEQGYAVVVQYHPEEFLISPDGDDLNRFDQLYGSMVSSLKRSTNPDSIVVHPVKNQPD